MGGGVREGRRASSKCRDEIVPFDEALRRLVNTPPQHRTKKEGDAKKRRPKYVPKSD